MFDLLERLVHAVAPPVQKRVPGANAPVQEEQKESLLQQVGHSVVDFASGVHHEGLSGLRDFDGMMDRADARRDLAHRFQVIDDPRQRRLPNQVSHREYDKIARTYSDIRRGRTDIKLAEDKHFRANALDDLADLMQTRSGRALVDRTAYHPKDHKTTLAPYLDAHGKPDPTNATTEGELDPAGSDVLIRANPNMDVEGGDVRIRSDVVLFHELVHGMHAADGTNDLELVKPWDAMLNEARKGNPRASELANDPHMALDAKYEIGRWEHQAAGLGLHADDPLTENAYRRERNEVALSGRGIAGDRSIRHRDSYVLSEDWYVP